MSFALWFNGYSRMIPQGDSRAALVTLGQDVPNRLSGVSRRKGKMGINLTDTKKKNTLPHKVPTVRQISSFLMMYKK